MKADAELYCWLLDWRKTLRERHASVVFTNPERFKDGTLYGQLAEEIDAVLTACDKEQPAP